MTRRKHSLLVARNDSSFSLQTVPMLMIYFSMFGQWTMKTVRLQVPLFLWDRNQVLKNMWCCTSCDGCTFKETTNGIFNKHVETIHEGVCYTCSQWDYKATTTPNLKRHVEAINELVCYSCKLSQCNGSNNKRLGNEETDTNKYIKIVIIHV